MNISKLATVIVALLATGSTYADTGARCFQQAGNSCLNMPGLSEGQTVQLKKDLFLDGKNSWLYFVSGKQIDVNVLVKNIGQSYCGITATQNSGSALTQKIEKGHFEVSEISWYVNTVFLRSGSKGFVIYCSTVDEKFTNPGVTSAAGIAKDLKGILE